MYAHHVLPKGDANVSLSLSVIFPINASQGEGEERRRNFKKARKV